MANELCEVWNKEKGHCHIVPTNKDCGGIRKEGKECSTYSCELFVPNTGLCSAGYICDHGNIDADCAIEYIPPTKEEAMQIDINLGIQKTLKVYG